jgi:hypothetical protein
MIGILQSDATHPSTTFSEVVRPRGEDNLRWLSRNLIADEGYSQIVMVGSTDPTAFRLRVAQSHLRHDMLPSHWSHAMLLGPIAEPLATTPVYEIPLDSPGGFGFPPPTNGVQQGQLGRYRRQRDYPNITILGIPVALGKVAEALDRFRNQRAVLDSLELLLRWLAFAWGVGRASNPLYDGLGIPSAAMLEIIFGTVGFDLTPGLESRASCPEAMWQAAKWWHEYYARENMRGLVGAYHIGQRLGEQ